MSNLTVVIIGYNSKKYLEKCFGSIAKQTMPADEVVYVDNDSEDGSVTWVEDHYPETTIIANKHNKGYAIAANQGIEVAETDYVMIANPDLILTSKYFEECLKVIKRDHQIAAITGKLMQYADGKTDIIDSTGLVCFRDRHVVDRGQGFKDKGLFEKTEEVFGVSGAAPIYSRKAINDASIMGEVFDNDFFMYKEDVDLSWRLRLFGYKCYYTPHGVAYHVRGTGVKKNYTHTQVAKGRKSLSKFQRSLSFKNQHLMQIKNELWPSYIRSFPWIAWKELLIFGYILIKEHFLIKAWWEYSKLIPLALRKRKLIMQKRKVSWREIDKWLCSREKQPK